MFGRKKVPDPEEYGQNRIYEFSTQEGREATADWLFRAAKDARTGKETEWVRYNDYYNFIHDVPSEMQEARAEMGITFTPAVVPDPFIMVESQVEPKVPEPEFKGRDTDMDSKKAKQREYAVKFILQNNDINAMNTSNEKRLKKLGDAFWKAYWDEDMPCGPHRGDIRIRDIPVEAVYVDPAAGADGLQAAQYVAYVYRVHKIRFWQIYGNELRKRGITLEEMVGREYMEGTGLFDMYSAAEGLDDTVDVMEFWYKQPFDTEDGKAKAGDVACSIQAGGKEVKYIPNYWQRTGRQCQLFPFVHYWCVRDENEFYNKPELFSIMSMVDAADRSLATGQLNDAMTANDIIVTEEGAMADGEELQNVPGATVTMKANKGHAIRRLGGLASGVNCLGMVQFMQGQIERANRNYDTNMGKETARVTTASGLAQIRGDADAQTQIKKADRTNGFKRLFELLDWLALEFYDDDRLIFLGAEKKGEEPVNFRFNSADYAERQGAIVDLITGEEKEPAWDYYPRVDVTVNVGDGIIRSKQATLETLDRLAAIPVNEDNYELLIAELEILDIPQKQEIVERWQRKFAPVVSNDVLAVLESDPRLLAAVEQYAAERAAAAQMEQEGAMATIPMDAGMEPIVMEQMTGTGLDPAMMAQMGGLTV